MAAMKGDKKKTIVAVVRSRLLTHFSDQNEAEIRVDRNS